MSGRSEKENQIRKRIEKKLKDFPEVFETYYNWLDAREKTCSTMNRYIDHIIEFYNFFTKGKYDKKFYEKVKEEDIERYMISIRQREVNGRTVGLGDSIRTAKWSSLNTFFKFLVQRKFIEFNPVSYTERPKMRTKNNVTYMDDDEIKSVLERIENESTDKLKNRDICIVTLGLATGLRVSAIVNIDIEDINFQTNTIKVIEKGRKTREIKFSNNLRNAIIVWLKDRELYFNGDPNSGPLFISRRKNRISVDSVECMIAKYTDHLSKHITPHKLRSSAAMKLYKNGVKILAIADQLGHENITTTQRYTSAYEKEKEEVIDILDSF